MMNMALFINIKNRLSFSEIQTVIRLHCILITLVIPVIRDSMN